MVRAVLQKPLGISVNVKKTNPIIVANDVETFQNYVENFGK